MNLDGPSLERLLTSDARRFLARTRDYFQLEQLPHPSSLMQFPLEVLLSHLAMLTEHQDAVFDFLVRGKQAGGGYIPSTPRLLFECAPQFVPLAAKRDKIVDLFSRLNDFGYTDSEWKSRTCPYAMIAARKGVLCLAEHLLLTATALTTVQREFGFLPPLYTSSYNSLFPRKDGVFCQPDSLLTIAHSPEQYLSGLRTFEPQPQASDYQNQRKFDRDLQRWKRSALDCASTWVLLGQHKAETLAYCAAVNEEGSGAPLVSPLSFASSWITLAQDGKVMQLFDALRPYASWTSYYDNVHQPGIVMDPFEFVQTTDCGKEGAQRSVTLKRLAADYSDALVQYARAFKESGLHFSLAYFCMGEDASRTLLGRVDALDRFVRAVAPYVTDRGDSHFCDKFHDMAGFSHMACTALDTMEPLLALCAYLGNRGVPLHGHLKCFFEQAPRLYEALGGAVPTAHELHALDSVSGSIYIEFAVDRLVPKAEVVQG